jgi:hypothetical protein
VSNKEDLLEVMEHEDVVEVQSNKRAKIPNSVGSKTSTSNVPEDITLPSTLSSGKISEEIWT